MVRISQQKNLELKYDTNFFSDWQNTEYWTDEEVGTVMSACIVLSMNSYNLLGKLIWQALLKLHSLNLKIGWLCDNRGFKSCYALCFHTTAVKRNDSNLAVITQKMFIIYC